MKYKEIAQMTNSEREKKLEELKLELIKSKVSSEKIKNSKIKQIKRTIARIHTFNNSKKEKLKEK